MPTPQDVEKLYRMDRIMRASGMTPLSPQELKAIYDRLGQVRNPPAPQGQLLPPPTEPFAGGGLLPQDFRRQP